MRKILFVLALLLGTLALTAQPVILSNATKENGTPLCGTYTINSAGSGSRNYTDFLTAVNELNLLGISGPVTFDVTAGQIFNYPVIASTNPAIVTPNKFGIIITATGTLDNPVIFRKAGNGANPVLNFTGSSESMDIGVLLWDCDYTTLDGIDVYDAGTSNLDFGYYLKGSYSKKINYITIKNCTVDLTPTSWGSTGIKGSNIKNCHFYSNTVQNSNTGYLFFDGQSNEIGSLDGISTITNIENTALMMFDQIDLKICNNIISNIFLTSSSSGMSISGIELQNCDAEIFNNSISNITGVNTYVCGINSRISPLLNIHDNTIYNLSCDFSVQGIYITGGNNINIYKNKIHNLALLYGTNFRSVQGISLQGSTTNNIYNNYIYDLKAPNAYFTPPVSWEYFPGNVIGMYLSSGITNNIYNNTVFLNYAPTGNNPNFSTAFYSTANAISIDLRNNIFLNMVDLSGNSSPHSKAVATIRNNTGFNNYSNTSNNNLYYAGTPGAKHYICFDGTNADTTLAQYKAHIATKDQKSVTELPPFINITSLPYDMHLSTTIPTQIENGGTPITSPFAVTDDFYGTLRNTLTPDIGAEEGNFTEYTIPTPLLNITLNSDGNIQLSWPPIPGANSYKIYASDDPNNIVLSINLLSTQAGTQYLDSTPETNKFYTVVASTDAVSRTITPVLKNTTKTMKGN